MDELLVFQISGRKQDQRAIIQFKNIKIAQAFLNQMEALFALVSDEVGMEGRTQTLCRGRSSMS
jgi:hypothetical protein